MWKESTSLQQSQLESAEDKIVVTQRHATTLAESLYSCFKNFRLQVKTQPLFGTSNDIATLYYDVAEKFYTFYYHTRLNLKAAQHYLQQTIEIFDLPKNYSRQPDRIKEAEKILVVIDKNINQLETKVTQPEVNKKNDLNLLALIEIYLALGDVGKAIFYLNQLPAEDIKAIAFKKTLALIQTLNQIAQLEESLLKAPRVVVDPLLIKRPVNAKEYQALLNTFSLWKRDAILPSMLLIRNPVSSADIWEVWFWHIGESQPQAKQESFSISSFFGQLLENYATTWPTFNFHDDILDLLVAKGKFCTQLPLSQRARVIKAYYQLSKCCLTLEHQRLADNYSNLAQHWKKIQKQSLNACEMLALKPNRIGCDLYLMSNMPDQKDLVNYRNAYIFIKNDPPKLFYASNNYSSKISQGKDYLLNGKVTLPNTTETIEFEEHEIKPNGDCGFTALGTDRKILTDRLLSLKNNAQDCEFLSEEILNAFVTYGATSGEEGLKPDNFKVWEALLQERDNAQQTLDKLYSEIKDGITDSDAKTLGVDPLINWLQQNKIPNRANQAQALIEKRLNVFQAETKLLSYHKKPEVFEYYVNAFCDTSSDRRLWLGYKSALLYAKQMNMALYIWRKSETIPNQLELIIYQEGTGGTPNEIHMLHTHGFTHFNLLSRSESIPLSKVLELKIDATAFERIDTKSIKDELKPLKEQVSDKILNEFWEIITSNEGHTRRILTPLSRHETSPGVEPQAIVLNTFPNQVTLGSRPLNAPFTEEELLEVLPHVEQIEGLDRSLNPVYTIQWLQANCYEDMERWVQQDQVSLRHRYDKHIYITYLMMAEAIQPEKEIQQYDWYLQAEQPNGQMKVIGFISKAADLATLAHLFKGVTPNDFNVLPTGQLQSNAVVVKKLDQQVLEELTPSLMASGFNQSESIFNSITKDVYEKIQLTENGGIVLYDLRSLDDNLRLKARLMREANNVFACILRFQQNYFIALLAAPSPLLEHGQQRRTLYWIDSSNPPKLPELLQWLSQPGHSIIMYELVQVLCPQQRAMSEDSLVHAYLNAVTAQWAYLHQEWDFVKKYLVQQFISSAENIEKIKKWLVSSEAKSLVSSVDHSLMAEIQKHLKAWQEFRSGFRNAFRAVINGLEITQLESSLKDWIKQLDTIAYSHELQEFIGVLGNFFVGEESVPAKEKLVAALSECVTKLQTLTVATEQAFSVIELEEIKAGMKEIISDEANAMLAYCEETTKAFEAFEKTLHHASLIFTFTRPLLSKQPVGLFWVSQLKLIHCNNDIIKSYQLFLDCITQVSFPPQIEFQEWQGSLREHCRQLQKKFNEVGCLFHLKTITQASWSEVEKFVKRLVGVTLAAKNFGREYLPRSDQQTFLYPALLKRCYDDLPFNALQQALKEDIYCPIHHYQRSFDDILKCILNLRTKSNVQSSVAFPCLYEQAEPHYAALQQSCHELITAGDELAVHYVSAYLRTTLCEVSRQYVDSVVRFRHQVLAAMETFEKELHTYLVQALKHTIDNQSTLHNTNVSFWHFMVTQFSPSLAYSEMVKLYQRLLHNMAHSDTTLSPVVVRVLQDCLQDNTHSHAAYLADKLEDLKTKLIRYAQLQALLHVFATDFRRFLHDRYDGLPDDSIFSPAGEIYKDILKPLQQRIDFNDIATICSSNSRLSQLINQSQGLFAAGDEKGSAEISAYLRECILHLTGDYMNSLKHFRIKAQQAFLQFETVLFEALGAYNLVINDDLREALARLIERLTGDYSSSFEPYCQVLNLLKVEKIASQAVNRLLSIVAEKTHSHAPYWMAHCQNLHKLLQGYVSWYKCDYFEHSDYQIIEINVMAGALSRIIPLIQKEYGNPFHPNNEIRIIATQVLYLDSDLTYPGVNIALIGPQQRLEQHKGTFSIKTDGSNSAGNGGAGHPAPAGVGMDITGEKGNPGENGLDGNPGKSAGHVYMVANQLPSIKISANGSKGGCGQDGGNGADGLDGADGNNGEDLNHKKHPYSFLRPFDLAHHRHRRIGTNGLPGTHGGDAGSAGYGGEGGKAGDVHLVSLQSSTHKPIINTKPGESGANGKPGKAGEAGKHGRDGLDYVLVENYKNDGGDWDDGVYRHSLSRDTVLKGGRLEEKERQDQDEEHINHRPYGVDQSQNFDMLPFVAGEDMPRFLSKYQDGSTAQGKEAKLYHANQKQVEQIHALDRDVIYQQTATFFAEFTNPNDLSSYCPWLAPTLNAFLAKLAAKEGFPPKNLHNLSAADAQIHALLALYEQFTAQFTKESERLAASQLETSQLSIGNLLLAQQLLDQYSAFTQDYDAMYQQLQQQIQQVDVSLLSNGLQIRSTRIAAMRNNINRIINESRFARHLAAQHRQTQALQEVPQEALSKTLTSRKNICFMKQYQSPLPWKPFATFKYLREVVLNPLVAVILKGSSEKTIGRVAAIKDEPTAESLLLIGDGLVKLDFVKALGEGDEVKARRAELARFLNNYWYNLQHVDWLNDKRRIYDHIKLLQQKEPKDIFINFVQQLAFLYQRQTGETIFINSTQDTLSKLYQKVTGKFLLMSKEARDEQSSLCEGLLIQLQNAQYTDEQKTNLVACFKQIIGHLDQQRPATPEQQTYFNTLMLTLAARLQVDGGLLITPLIFQQVLECLGCFQSLLPAIVCLLSTPQEQWLKALLIEHLIEKAQYLYPGLKADDLRGKLATKIDEELLRVFHNLLLLQYRDQIQQAMTGSQTVILAAYQQITLEKLNLLMKAMQDISPEPVLMNQLASASLMIWDNLLHEVDFSKRFSQQIATYKMVGDEVAIEKCLLLLNRIRVEVGTVQYQKKFIPFFEAALKNSEAHSLDHLNELLLAVVNKVISIEESQYVFNKVSHSSWPLAINKEASLALKATQHTENRSIEEITTLMRDDTRFPVANDLLNELASIAKDAKAQILKWKQEQIAGNEKTFIETEIKQVRNDNQYQIAPERYVRVYLAKIVGLLLYAWSVANPTQFPRDTQIVALVSFILSGDKGLLAQIRTGEGKTQIVGLTAAFMALCGYAVDIVSSNRDLAIEGEIKCQDFFKLLKLGSGHVCSEDDSANHQAYENPIVYGEVSSFQRDILEAACHSKETFGKRYDNKPKCLIVDEVDNMCLDKARHMLYLSHELESLKWLETLFINIWAAVAAVDITHPEEISSYAKEIATFMHEAIKKEDLFVPAYLKDFVKKKMKIWVKSAFQARMMHENDQFVMGVSKGLTTDLGQRKNIIIIDKATGTEQYSTRWSQGLAQFMELKYRQRLSTESLKAVFISNKAFFQRYQSKLYGLTGTLGSQHSQSFLAELYGVRFINIPVSQRKCYQQLPPKVAFDHADWLKVTVEEAIKQIKTRPVLIICDNIDVSENHLRSEFHRQGVSHYNLHKYTRDGDNIEEYFRHQPANAGNIILATNKGGRGTDIRVSPDVAQGMHVILNYLPDNERIEEQAFGRTARNGKPGTGQFIILVEAATYKEMYQLDRVPADQLRSRLDELADSILEREKIARDNKESTRLSELKHRDILRLETEERLFEQFVAFRKIMREEVWQPFCNIVPDKETGPKGGKNESDAKRTKNNSDKSELPKGQEQDSAATKVEQAKRDQLEVLDTIVKNQWAFWLDLAKKKISRVESIHEQQALLAEFGQVFAERAKKVGKNPSLERIVNFIDKPEEVNRLGQTYLQASLYAKDKEEKKRWLQSAKICFEAGLKKDDLTGFSRIGLAYCIIELKGDVRVIKKTARRELKEALVQMELFKQSLMANYEIATYLPKLSSVDIRQHLSSKENCYREQLESKLGMLGLNLHYLKKAVGVYLEPTDFIDTHYKMPNIFSIYQFKKIYIEENCYEDTSDYKLSYVLTQNPCALFFIDSQGTKIEIKISHENTQKVVELIQRISNPDVLKPINSILTHSELLVLQSIMYADPQQAINQLSATNRGQKIHDLLIDGEILYGDCLRKAMKRDKARMERIITKFVDPSIAGSVIDLLKKNDAFKQTDFENIVCHQQEIWQAIIQSQGVEGCGLYLMSKMPDRKDLVNYRNAYIFIKNDPPQLFYASNNDSSKVLELKIDATAFKQIDTKSIKDELKPLKEQVSDEILNKFWGIITSNEGHTRVESVYLLDINKLKQDLAASYESLWQELESLIDPFEVKMLLFETSEVRKIFKEYLINNRFLIKTERISINKVRLNNDDLFLNQYAKYKKVRFNCQGNNKSTLIDYLQALIKNLEQQQQAKPEKFIYLYQTDLPFGTKEEEANKIRLFLKDKRILKSGGFVKAYKEGDTKEIIVKKLNELITKMPVLAIYLPLIEKNLNLVQGDIRACTDGVKATLKHFMELEGQEAIPSELRFFTGLGLDTFLLITNDKSWWDWHAFAVAMIGLAQVIVGALLIATGVGAYVGQALISEGISDMLYATIAGISGTFSWREWGIQKAVSFSLSMMTAGIKTLANLSKLLQAGRKAQIGSVTHLILVGKLLQRAACNFALECGNHFLTEKLMETIGQDMIEKIVENIENMLLNDTMQHLREQLPTLNVENIRELEAKLETIEEDLKKQLQNDTQLPQVLEVTRLQVVSRVKAHSQQLAKNLKQNGNKYAKMAGMAIKAGTIATEIWKLVESTIQLTEAVSAFKTIINQTFEVHQLKQGEKKNNQDKQCLELKLKNFRKIFKDHLSQHLSATLRQVLNKAISSTFDLTAKAIQEAHQATLDKHMKGKDLISEQQAKNTRANALKILGFAENDSPSPTEITRAYQQRALKYHPDKCLHISENSEKFKELVHARDTLIPPVEQRDNDSPSREYTQDYPQHSNNPREHQAVVLVQQGIINPKLSKKENLMHYRATVPLYQQINLTSKHIKISTKRKAGDDITDTSKKRRDTPKELAAHAIIDSTRASDSKRRREAELKGAKYRPFKKKKRETHKIRFDQDDARLQKSTENYDCAQLVLASILQVEVADIKTTAPLNTGLTAKQIVHIARQYGYRRAAGTSHSDRSSIITSLNKYPAGTLVILNRKLPNEEVGHSVRIQIGNEGKHICFDVKEGEALDLDSFLLHIGSFTLVCFNDRTPLESQQDMSETKRGKRKRAFEELGSQKKNFLRMNIDPADQLGNDCYGTHRTRFITECSKPRDPANFTQNAVKSSGNDEIFKTSERKMWKKLSHKRSPCQFHNTEYNYRDVFWQIRVPTESVVFIYENKVRGHSGALFVEALLEEGGKFKFKTETTTQGQKKFHDERQAVILKGENAQEAAVNGLIFTVNHTIGLKDHENSQLFNESLYSTGGHDLSTPSERQAFLTKVQTDRDVWKLVAEKLAGRPLISDSSTKRSLSPIRSSSFFFKKQKTKIEKAKTLEKLGEVLMTPAPYPRKC